MDTKYNSLGNLSNTDRWQMFPSARLDLSGKSALYDYNFTSTTTQPLRQKSGLYTELSSQQRNSYMSDSTSPR